MKAIQLARGLAPHVAPDMDPSFLEQEWANLKEHPSYRVVVDNYGTLEWDSPERNRHALVWCVDGRSYPHVLTDTEQAVLLLYNAMVAAGCPPEL